MSPSFKTIRTLQAGWWENVLLVEVDGRPRVRKELHRLDAPWARDVFVKEWRYLTGLPESLRPPFVSVVDQCDELTDNAPPTDRPLWFDMEYLDGFTDVRSMLAADDLEQNDADSIQELLATALLDGIYRLPGEPFDAEMIVWPVIEQVLTFALNDDHLSPFARPNALIVNGNVRPNLETTLRAARTDPRVSEQLTSAPSVRLHGDLFYENVLYRPDPPAIRLIDPVSVAGVDSGPVVFDRVKFASWVSGELYALRHGAFELTTDRNGHPPGVEYAWKRGDPVIDNLQRLDVGAGVLSAMDKLTGPSEQAQAVLEAYFNLAMVPNTPMPQRLLRYARAVEHLAQWA